MASTVASSGSSASRRQPSARRADADALVLEHLDLVRQVAFQLLARMPVEVELDDLIQSGRVGLICASRQYDPLRGTSFRAFALLRVRGAMLDEARRADWAPRSVRSRMRALQAATQRLRHESAAPPGHAALASEAGITLDDYHRVLRDALCSRALSIDALAADGPSAAAGMVRDDGPGPAQQFERYRLLADLVGAVRELPERLRLVLSLYYDEDLNLRQIGEALAVTESRACQLHAQARAEVRLRMQPWLDGRGLAAATQ